MERLQASLLLQLDPPKNGENRRAWSAKIRQEIGTISKYIRELEKQKQQLLSRLYEAGDTDEMVASESQTETLPREDRYPPTDEIPDNDIAVVIDLLSDDSLPPVFSDPPSPPSPVPDELPPTSPGIPVQRAPSESPLDPPRVLKPGEFHMIDWGQVPLVDLKGWADHFGLKPSLGKTVLISELQKIFKYLRNEVIVPDSLPSLIVDKQSMFTRMAELLRSNHSLLEQILVFESVEFDDVFQFLKSALPEDQIPPNLKQAVREFLDVSHIQFNTTAVQSKRKRKPVEVQVSRKLLRQSLSCPPDLS
jgi:hypothetical protein